MKLEENILYDFAELKQIFGVSDAETLWRLQSELKEMVEKGEVKYYPPTSTENAKYKLLKR